MPARDLEPPAETGDAFEAGEMDGFAQYLDSVADELARLRETRAELLASVVPTISIAESVFAPALQSISELAAFPGRELSKSLAASLPGIADYAFAPTLGAISKLAVPPDLGFLKTRLSDLSLTASLPELSIARRAFPAVGDLGFLQGIATMANSWDHGLLGASRQFAGSAAALAAAPAQELLRSAALAIAPHQELLRSMAGLAASRAAVLSSLTDFAAMSATAGLVDLFRSWRETAETGLGLLRRLARAAHRAALLARDAVLDGDDGPVAWFIEDWLGMRVTPERIEAVGAALLEEGWDASVPEDPDYLITDLRRRIRRQARVLRPIWETQLNLRTIGQLDRAATAGNGTLLTVADLVPDPHTTEDLALAGECEEQRLAPVLSRLKPEEAQVTTVWAQGSELTWTEAARLTGVPDPAAMGERVRRKLKRLGTEHSRRLVQAGGA